MEALIALLEEGNTQPTAAEIAARAGVAERTLFQHFADRDALFMAISERQTERLTDMWVDIPRDAPFAQRLDAFVDLRAQVYEFVSPVRRGALLMEAHSDVVSEGVSGFRRLKRREAASVFESELSALPDDKREATKAALGAATSWSSWEELRRHQGLSVERSRAALRRTIEGLLGS